MMHEALEQADAFFAACYGIDCTTLLAPIDPAQPQGEPLRGTPLWQRIRQARERDDATLPLGAWQRDLKRAAWDQVAHGALEALADHSKDLQLAVWLAEALLYEHGFAGLAAGVTMVAALCERYWDSAYPQLARDRLADGAAQPNLEHRANLFHWLNEKLLVPVRLVPITVAPREGRPYAWADWEHVRRAEQALAASGRDARDGGGELFGGVDPDEFARAVGATPGDALLELHGALDWAVGALAGLGVTLDRLFAAVDDAPGVGTLRGQLEQIRAFVATELRQRGLSGLHRAAAAMPTRNWRRRPRNWCGSSRTARCRI